MGNVVDLVAVGRASTGLARWWREFLVDPDRAGEHLRQLEEARCRLAALGPVPGRLGRAVALVVAGGGPSAAESVRAIELLAAIADRAGVASPTSRRRVSRASASTARSRAATGGAQPSLPGL